MAKNSHSVLFFVEPQVVCCLFCLVRCDFSSCFCAKLQFLQEIAFKSLKTTWDVQTIILKVKVAPVSWKSKNQMCWSNYSQTWESFLSKFSYSSLKKLSKTWSTWSFSFSVISKIKNWIKFKKWIISIPRSYKRNWSELYSIIFNWTIFKNVCLSIFLL